MGVVGLDVAKNKADGCIRSAGWRSCRRRARREERPSWLRGCAQTRVGRAGMEASGDCERSWAKRGRVERPRDADVTAAATEVLDRTYGGTAPEPPAS